MASSLKGTYTYNGLEQLAIRITTNQTPAGTTHFIHDIFGNVIAETAGGGATGSTGVPARDGKREGRCAVTQR